MALNHMAIASYGAYPGAGKTAVQRAASAVSQGLLTVMATAAAVTFISWILQIGTLGLRKTLGLFTGGFNKNE